MVNNKTKKILIKDIIPYKHNAKIHTPEQIERIKKSIEDHGYIQKICIGKKNVVIIGHGRLEALKLINPDMEIEVVDLSDFPEDKIRKLRIIDNRLNDLSEWDMNNLENEIKDIYKDIESSMDIISEELSYDQKDIDRLFSRNILDKSNELDSIYQIIISCKDEKSLEKEFNKLKKEGYECKILVL